MNKTEFKKTLKSLSNQDGILDKELINSASNNLKNDTINYIVRNRQAIVKHFLNEETDMNWLHAMGYLYHSKNKNFDFLCTSENMKVG